MSSDRTEFNRRRAAVEARLEEEGLDALIAYSTAKAQANVRYLTDYSVRFTGMQSLSAGGYHMFGACICLVAPGEEPTVRTDQEWDVARARETSIFADTNYASLFASDIGRIIDARGYRRVGIDNWYLFPAREFIALRDLAPQTDFVPTHALSEVRRIKSPAEIAIMRRAAELADRAVSTSFEIVKPGVSEYEVLTLCEQVMREGGDIELGGGSISGCGPNTATGTYIPARTQNRVMESGEWVMMDVTPRVDGYCSDISRHRVAGDLMDLDPRLKSMYEACLLMNQEARSAVRAGVSGKQLNDIATEVAAQEGFLDLKIGLLGHGVGLDIHDLPDYYYDNSPLSAGEVVTIEPCLLLPGVGGVRIEDLVLVTEGGSETLTSVGYELTS